MHYKKFAIIFILFNFCTSLADEFLYPVGILEKDGSHQVYLLYQKSIKHIELWLWDPISKVANKALLSSFTPAGLRLLPDQSGFSFIDNGRIKIKHFDKRSPKSLDIYEPIYDIGILEWIDNNCCYFSAKEQEHTAIYQTNMRGDLDCICKVKGADCIYPQKIGEDLFYIERTPCNDGCRYKIMQSPYPQITYDDYTFSSTQHFDERVLSIIKKNQKKADKQDPTQQIKSELIADFGEQAIAFLYMKSGDEGYILEHPNQIDKQEKTIIIDYHQLKKIDGAWKRSYLFSFEIPMHFLLVESSSRLYESMLPLLPKHIDDTIYFVDASNFEHFNLNIHSFDLINGEIKKLSDASMIGQNFFGPIKIGDKIYFGGSLMAELEEDQNLLSEVKFIDYLPSMRISNGFLCFDLPFLKNL